nr:VanZ family protein [Nocardioides soli]
MLNTLIFVPAGALLVLAVARWRAAWVLVPLGLAGLAAYSVAIEGTQLALARIDRACDVTDVVDNVTGAALGVGIGIVLALVLRPWRYRRRA